MERSKRLVINKNLKSPIGEAYKTLRTNIQFSMPKGELKTMLITSSSPEEGKSTTCANLAITMAQSGNRVLLVDADLRRSMVHKIFTISNFTGLTNILAEDMDYKEVLKSAEIEGLDIIPGGPKPPNPSELLGSRNMKNFLERVKEDYDFVLIDTPPILPVTDASILASLVDGVIMVAGYGQTTIELISKAKAQLDNVNAKILGVILNQVPNSKYSGHYNYYYYDSSDD